MTEDKQISEDQEKPQEDNDIPEKMLYDSNPSMFRNRPFFFILSIAMVVMGVVGLMVGWLNDDQPKVILGTFALGIFALILFYWWLSVVNMRLAVTTERVRYSKGILSKSIREVFLSDIRSVQINQRLLQRIFISGELEVSSAASSEAEIRIDGIPSPYEVKKIIDEHRRHHPQ
ncbi:conserved hypothetical protein, membrane [Beggiatoa sp. PS]|nr:conserved hypothetical protein, membrane [Beggiatoa sp. PS]